MYILAIETTGKFGSVSLIDNKGTAIGYLETTDPMSHLKNLIPMIKKLLVVIVRYLLRTLQRIQIIMRPSLFHYFQIVIAEIHFATLETLSVLLLSGFF